MPAHKRICAFLLVCGLFLSAGVSAATAEPVSIRAMMILASNEPAAQDPRLENVEYKLRRIFGFEYYRHYGEANTVVNLPGSANLDLGHGFSLQLGLAGSDGSVRANVNWMRAGQSVLSTAVKMSRRAPVILGGISHGGGTLIVTLVTE